MDRVKNISKIPSAIWVAVLFLFVTSQGFAAAEPTLLFEQFYATAPQRSANSVWIQDISPRVSIEAMREFFPPSYRLLDFKSSPQLIEFLGSQILDPICKAPLGEQLCKAAYKLLSRKYSAESVNTTLLSFFTFVLYKNGQPAVESWSIGYESWVFIDVDHDTLASVRRRIIHELYQMVDFKNQLLFKPQYLLLDGFSLSCLSMQSLGNRIVRLGTSSLRALAFEELMLADLGIPQGKYSWSEKNCGDKLKAVEPYIQQISKRLSFEILKGANAQIGCNVTPNAISLSEALLELQSNFQALNKMVAPQVSPQNLCEYLITPDTKFEKLSDEVGVDHGPRPRIGDPD